MNLLQCAHAGTLESSDVYIQIEPIEEGVQIDLQSSVEEIYGDAITELVHEVLEGMNISNVLVKVQDKGALDYVIKARLQTALLRATNQDEPTWEALS